MSDNVTYTRDGAVATITMDDGKVNALSLERFAELNKAFDQAEQDGAVVVLTGREGIFSAGFDLAGLGAEPSKMLEAGFELAARLLAFPRPVVVACTGHAIAMGVFLVLSGDYRIGTAGDYRIVANEVAIGLTMPLAAIEVARLRLPPAHFQRAMNLAEVYSPAEAVPAGFLDDVVDVGDLAAAARTKAEELTKLNMDAHATTKLRVRDGAIKAIRTGLETDMKTFAGLGSGATSPS